MHRRQFVRRTGFAGVAVATSLAGCSSGSGGLAVTATDSVDASELHTVMVTATVENTAGESKTATLVGEIVVEDEETFTGRRRVTVPGDGQTEFDVKVRYGDVGMVAMYEADARIETDSNADGSLEPAGYHDLVVVDSASEDDDGVFDVTADVENWASASRSATLVGVVDFDGTEYTEEQSISLSGGERNAYDFTIRSDEFGMYTAGARVE